MKISYYLLVLIFLLVDAKEKNEDSIRAGDKKNSEELSGLSLLSKNAISKESRQNEKYEVDEKSKMGKGVQSSNKYNDNDETKNKKKGETKTKNKKNKNSTQKTKSKQINKKSKKIYNDDIKGKKKVERETKKKENKFIAKGKKSKIINKNSKNRDASQEKMEDSTKKKHVFNAKKAFKHQTTKSNNENNKVKKTKARRKNKKEETSQFSRKTTCRPSKRCLKAKGKCTSEKCQGMIISKGCKKPKGCQKTICCAPSNCKPTKKCKNRNGKCIPKKTECAGDIIKNGCKKQKFCRKTHICCAPKPASPKPIVITTAVPTKEDIPKTKKPTIPTDPVIDEPPSIVEFIYTYNKTYANEDETAKRNAILMKNMETVRDHNNLYVQGKSSFLLGVNEYSDMTYDEVIRDLTGAKEPDISLRYSQSQYTPKDIGEEPDFLDYRDWGAVNSIKNQRHCGSCWAFSAIGSIESNFFLKIGILPQLSEQELVDCDKVSLGCAGGYWGRAIGYVIDHGISYEKDYPYTAQDGTCNKDAGKASLKLKSLKKVAYGSDADLLNALVHIGPIAVAIFVSDNFQKYKTGILEDNLCVNEGRINHAVVLVGYGTENGKDYWLLRNSWGETWGEKGYIKLSRNVNNHCSISTWGYFPEIEENEGAVVFVHPPEMSCKGAGGAWTRPSGDVSNSVQGVADCAAKCAGYTYFGLECPRDTVHCQCANTLSGSTSVDDCDRQLAHCIGPFTQGGYMMGGADRGSVYLVKPSDGDSGCSGEAINFGSQCLTFIGKELDWDSGEALNWDDAVAACAANGQRLATLEHPDDVRQYLRDNVDSHRFWTGASDSAKEGSWKWTDNQALDENFPGERNGGSSENCMVVRGTDGYYDLPCSYLNRYICEDGPF